MPRGLIRRSLAPRGLSFTAGSEVHLEGRKRSIHKVERRPAAEFGKSLLVQVEHAPEDQQGGVVTSDEVLVLQELVQSRCADFMLPR